MKDIPSAETISSTSALQLSPSMVRALETLGGPSGRSSVTVCVSFLLLTSLSLSTVQTGRMGRPTTALRSRGKHHEEPKRLQTLFRGMIKFLRIPLNPCFASHTSKWKTEQKKFLRQGQGRGPLPEYIPKQNINNFFSKFYKMLRNSNILLFNNS